MAYKLIWSSAARDDLHDIMVRALFCGPIAAALMLGPFRIPKCYEELLDELILAGLRDDDVNEP